jgi:hypothetical protein
MREQLFGVSFCEFVDDLISRGLSVEIHEGPSDANAH